MDPRLKQLQMRDGRGRLVPRFYPPGKHPATARMRAEITYLREVVRFDPDDFGEEQKRLTKLLDQIAAFEEKETEVKYEGLKLFEERDRRRRE